MPISRPSLEELQQIARNYHFTLSDEEAVETAVTIWTRINLLNLNENILPTRQRADLILKKVESHLVEEVALRRL